MIQALTFPVNQGGSGFGRSRWRIAHTVDTWRSIGTASTPSTLAAGTFIMVGRITHWAPNRQQRSAWRPVQAHALWYSLGQATSSLAVRTFWRLGKPVIAWQSFQTQRGQAFQIAGPTLQQQVMGHWPPGGLQSQAMADSLSLSEALLTRAIRAAISMGDSLGLTESLTYGRTVVLTPEFGTDIVGGPWTKYKISLTGGPDPRSTLVDLTTTTVTFFHVLPGTYTMLWTASNDDGSLTFDTQPVAIEVIPATGPPLKPGVGMRDTLTMSETIVLTPSVGGGGVIKTLSIGDTLTLVESLVAKHQAVKSVGDTIAILEHLDRLIALAPMSEVLGPTEALSRAVQKKITEFVVLQESLTGPGGNPLVILPLGNRRRRRRLVKIHV